MTTGRMTNKWKALLEEQRLSKALKMRIRRDARIARELEAEIAGEPTPRSEKMRKEEIRKFGAMFGSEYCTPDGLVFVLDSKYLDFDKYILSVKDSKGEGKMNWEIKMDDPLGMTFGKFTVHDNHYNIIMTLRESPIAHWWGKINIRPRWKVYKGDSRDEKDFLFTVKHPWLCWKGDLEVYLPSTKEEAGGFDFEVIKSWLNKDCVVKNKKGKILAEGKEGRGWFNDYSYTVSVRPGVDYAFIVALIGIFYELTTGGADARLIDPNDMDSD